MLALHGGAVLAAGAPREVVDEALLTALYGVPVRLVETPQGVAVLPGKEDGA